MRTTVILLGFILAMAAPALAGKNANGALIVHTAPYSFYFSDPCDDFDDPGTCENANTQTDNDEVTASVIWFIAAFDDVTDPGVSVVYFGNDHNLPDFYHSIWGFCGPPGTIEVADAGWPDDPAGAGNSVAFGVPVTGNRLFPFYYVGVFGFEGAYYGTGINPTGGYAAFVDDSNPPVTDHTDQFGQVRWYEPGYNECPVPPQPGACCFDTGACQALLEEDCDDAGGAFQGEGTGCDPNPCTAVPAACCFIDGHCEMFSGLDCQYFEGSWQGLGSVCDPNPCFQPLEACCFTDGTCTFVEPPDCEAAGGTPQGWGTTCEMISCRPPVIGACCYGDEECAVTTQEDCADVYGSETWFPDEDCESGICVDLATEETTWGKIKAGYR